MAKRRLKKIFSLLHRLLAEREHRGKLFETTLSMTSMPTTVRFIRSVRFIGSLIPARRTALNALFICIAISRIRLPVSAQTMYMNSRAAIADLEQRINSASTSERVKLNKRLTAMQAQATEIREYEEKIHHLADQMIRIDLDDGVKHNYEIFKDVLAKIK